MRIFIFLLIFFYCLAFGKSEFQPKVEIFASKILYLNNLVNASGDVVVLYNNTILLSDRAIYDQNRSLLELFGNVEIIKGIKYGSLSDYAKFDLKENDASFTSIFLTQTETALWAKGSNAEKKAHIITLRNALVSSCDVECPDWTMHFSTLEYDEEKEWLNVWNPLIYMGDVPVLYFPYIGFSTNTKRRSGLLYPSLGISSRDGFIYRQPIYIATSPEWDLEFDPQIRSLRGKGIFSTLRFVDSPNSHGSFTTGYFRNKSSYVNQYNIKNSSHYGYQLLYNSAKLFSDNQKSSRDGIYLDITYLKDPDYLNLQKESLVELLYSSQIQSRINYYFDTPQYYAGIYGKYFIDTSLQNNKETIQTFPIVQLHKYQNIVLDWNNLQYSADYKISNFFTGSGQHTQLQEINLPLTFYGSLFGDYIKYSISENMYYAYIGYQNIDLSGKESYYKFFRNYHKIDLYSDLARPYANFFHTLQLRATYNRPSYTTESGYIDQNISVLRSPKENMILSAVNYFYDFSGKEWLFYRVSQPLYFENSEHDYGDIENEIRLKFWNNYELYSNIFYSYYKHNITSESSHIKYRDSVYDIMLTHFYKKTEEEIVSDFFTFSTRVKYNEGSDVYASFAYNNIDSTLLKWEAGIQLFRGCWDFLLGIKNEKRPILTSIGAESINNFAVYFQINLFPLGGISQVYEQRF
ncbi:LPS-assembly protein LptD [Hydrogenimonas thermophila]|uniref:LPS-assembly protein n=1 Tax=Hydrogenimonas thermophila TaxID=223786 RepID=A0A1I5MC28_9BACT|nr:LPS-assembly protein LptD [Hydrogenimonas thermophila]SFP06506.1 LPS-assembly protein [Hydrogenimonas thermophila]